MTTRTLGIVRTHDDRRVPAPGVYSIDAGHSSVQFIARHLMITKVRGRVPAVTGTITVADEPERSHVEARLSAASIDTGNRDRDRHLRSADFFDVDRHPLLVYRSTGVRATTGGDWLVTGDLTIRGVTHQIDLLVHFDGSSSTDEGEERVGFSSSVDVDRERWGVSWNRPLEAGGLLIAPTVRVELDIQAVASPNVEDGGA